MPPIRTPIAMPGNGQGATGSNKKGGPDNPQIQEDGSGGRCGKVPQRIQHSHEKCYNADKEYIRESNSGEEHGEIVLESCAAESECLYSNDPWRQENSRNRKE